MAHAAIVDYNREVLMNETTPLGRLATFLGMITPPGFITHQTGMADVGGEKRPCTCFYYNRKPLVKFYETTESNGIKLNVRVLRGAFESKDQLIDMLDKGDIVFVKNSKSANKHSETTPIEKYLENLRRVIGGALKGVNCKTLEVVLDKPAQ